MTACYRGEKQCLLSLPESMGINMSFKCMFVENLYLELLIGIKEQNFTGFL